MPDSKVPTPPTANIQANDSVAHQLFGGSRLWLLTLLCLIVSAGLVWWSLPQRGVTINIQFPEGHGLQPDDTVRFRGIEVGTVESVKLDNALDGVDVEVLLKPFADQLATEGTRFWIVRPELSLTRISGLETAIGHKYIGVSPNTDSEDGAAKTTYRFRGLADVPVDTLSEDGLELILRGDKRFSVSKGSTVTFRGVEVGTVLDVVLSQNARHVDVRVRIFNQHAQLLTSETKFWATSGLDLDFKFGFNGGFNLDTESLETLARGGVSMITTGQGKSVSPGDVFTLHASSEDAWFTQANNFRMTKIALKGAVPLSASWTAKSLFGSKQKEVRFNGLASNIDGVRQFIFPADIISEGRELDSFHLQAFGKPVSLESSSEKAIGPHKVVLLPLQSQEAKVDFLMELHDEDAISDCLAVRVSDDLETSFHLPVNASSIKPNLENPEIWDLIDFNGDRKVWHGSPVLSASDGKLIGILLIEARKAQIIRAAAIGR
jgi:sporulation protein YlmC with PRC-barrel domain